MFLSCVAVCVVVLVVQVLAEVLSLYCEVDAYLAAAYMPLYVTCRTLESVTVLCRGLQAAVEYSSIGAWSVALDSYF